MIQPPPPSELMTVAAFVAKLTDDKVAALLRAFLVASADLEKNRDSLRFLTWIRRHPLLNCALAATRVNWEENEHNDFWTTDMRVALGQRAADYMMRVFPEPGLGTSDMVTFP